MRFEERIRTVLSRIRYQANVKFIREWRIQWDAMLMAVALREFDDPFTKGRPCWQKFPICTARGELRGALVFRQEANSNLRSSRLA